MNPNEIAKSYDLLADQWNSAAFPRSNGIVQHQRAITFLKEKRSALDFGCSSSGRFIDLLIGHGFEVEGLDLSERMIELARQRHPHITGRYLPLGLSAPVPSQWEIPPLNALVHPFG